MPETAPAPSTTLRESADARLQLLRECPTAHQLRHYADILQQLATDHLDGQLNSAQALELQAFQLHAMAADMNQPVEAMLVQAMDLHLRAQTAQYLPAQAAALRALHWIQMRMRLHHASLDSLARAAELYERCGQPQLALLVQAARCRVLLSAEMHIELHAFCAGLLARPEVLPPTIHAMLHDYAASASYYLAVEQIDTPAAEPHWRDCLAHREQFLKATRSHQLRAHECLALLNLAIVNATCEHADASRAYMRQLREQFVIDVNWESWLQLCELLIQCVEGERAVAWQALLDYDAWLDSQSGDAVRQREISLISIRRYGRRWGHLEQALQACATQIAFERQHKRELARSLGDTLNAVMERPQLLYQNAVLAQQGTELENALMQRNLELNDALATLRQEAAVRQQAEAALRQAHDELEQKVRERSAELAQALQSLMQREKQLGLSRLVVGMAHEMNTPLGNARVAASVITGRAGELTRLLDSGTLRRSQLLDLLDNLTEGGGLIERALGQISELVDRFKGLSVDPTQEARVVFNLSDRLRFFHYHSQQRLRARGIHMTLSLPDNLWLEGYPGALQVVFQHLLDNCLQHAFAGDSGGTVTVSARGDGPALLLQWEDDGCGIAAQHLSRVLDPFYTTQLGQTGKGLGLSSVHSIVVNLMQGQVAVESGAGRGTRIVLRLPVAPGQPPDAAAAR
ncbi:MAG: HAMP domain-containing histidine kinase [Burkholderiaceae bacterium]|nr:HAMP domain-containing histidine kinase [Burkholderiaceae bacterium]